MRTRSQIHLTPLVLALALLAPAGAEETRAAEAAAPPAPVDGGAKPAAEEAGSAEVRAESRYVEAAAKFRAGAFAEALDLVEQAIAIYPPHAGAQKLRQDVLGVLSQRENRLKMAATWFATLQDVRTQETAVRLAGTLERGDAEMAAGDYFQAELDFDRVEIGIRSFPYRFDWGDLPQKVTERKAAARAKARERELSRQQSDRQAAAATAQHQAELQNEALKLKVDELMRRAGVAYKRKDYKRAEIESWNAYELDRRREDARELYLASRREGHLEFDAKYRTERTESIARVAEEIHKSLIPQNELLVYPEDWQNRAMRKPREIGSQKAEPWMAALNDRLEQRITFDFQDTSFEDVVTFLRQVTGVNIIVAPAVLAQAGGGTVTLKVRDMRFRDALKWILEITNLKMAIQDQALFISNEPIQGAVVLRLYDITDLSQGVKDFPGKDLAYTAGAGGKAGGLALVDTGAAGAGAEQKITPDQLVEFIKKNVSPKDWGANNVDIQQRSGSTLFVSHSPEGHKQIEELLRNLRNQSSTQVNIGVRILDVRKGFFEEIGMEWHNNPVGMIDNAGTQTGNGYIRQNGNAASGYLVNGSLYQQMPGNSAGYGINPATNPGQPVPKGMVLEGAMNTSGFMNADQVNFIFSAAEDETDATVLQHPTLTCFNGQRANATFIQQYAYISDYEIVATNYDPVIAVMNVGNILDVRPVISSDRKYITMEVRPTAVTLQGSYTETITATQVIQGNGSTLFIPGLEFPLELPNVQVQTLRSTVMLPDKGSLIIGGFNNSLRQRTSSGVPFISHIPFLGRLFSRNGTYDQDRKVFYMLSASVLDMNEQESLQ